jgi:hypothetical protein
VPEGWLPSDALDNDGAKTESNNDSMTRRIAGFVSVGKAEIIADERKNG